MDTYRESRERERESLFKNCVQLRPQALSSRRLGVGLRHQTNHPGNPLLGRDFTGSPQVTKKCSVPLLLLVKILEFIAFTLEDKFKWWGPPKSKRNRKVVAHVNK